MPLPRSQLLALALGCFVSAVAVLQAAAPAAGATGAAEAVRSGIEEAVASARAAEASARPAAVSAAARVILQAYDVEAFGTEPSWGYAQSQMVALSDLDREATWRGWAFEFDTSAAVDILDYTESMGAQWVGAMQKLAAEAARQGVTKLAIFNATYAGGGVPAAKGDTSAAPPFPIARSDQPRRRIRR